MSYPYPLRAINLWLLFLMACLQIVRGEYPSAVFLFGQLLFWYGFTARLMNDAV